MNPIVDRSAPGVRITLLPDERAEGGEPLDLGGRIIAFTFEDAERKADQVSIQLDNFDLSLFDREDLAGGAVLEVSWGYPGNMAPPRRVVVRKLKGFTTLTLEGRATSVLMDREAKTRAFENMSRADVARAIAEEHGYVGTLVDVEDTGEVLEVVNQTGETATARSTTRRTSPGSCRGSSAVSACPREAIASFGLRPSSDRFSWATASGRLRPTRVVNAGVFWYLLVVSLARGARRGRRDPDHP